MPNFKSGEEGGARARRDRASVCLPPPPDAYTQVTCMHSQRQRRRRIPWGLSQPARSQKEGKGRRERIFTFFRVAENGKAGISFLIQFFSNTTDEYFTRSPSSVVFKTVPMTVALYVRASVLKNQILLCCFFRAHVIRCKRGRKDRQTDSWEGLMSNAIPAYLRIELHKRPYLRTNPLQMYLAP